MYKLTRCCAAVVLCFSGVSFAAADEGKGLGEKVFTAELVRVSELTGGPAGQAGADPLSRGHVDVRLRREIETTVFGAAQTATYDIVFCRATVVSQPLCVALGALTTDAKGYGTARLPFPAAGENWTGAFVLTRGGSNQFVSGFRFPPLEESQSGAVEVEFKGPVGSLNPANQSLRLTGLAMDIFVTSSTRLEGVDGFAGFKIGEVVKVSGTVRPDGAVQALRVEVEGIDDGHSKKENDKDSNE